MTIQEIRDQVDKVLGNSLKCLLPSYWFKILFGITLDKVEEVNKTSITALTSVNKLSTTAFSGSYDDLTDKPSTLPNPNSLVIKKNGEQKVSYTGSSSATADITGDWYGTSSTSASTATKSVSCSNYTLTSGERIAVKFTYANTASNPKLNVNYKGAKPIYWNGSALPSSQYWSDGAVIEFLYDGSYYHMLGAIVSIDSEMSNISENPVQNKVITDKYNIISNEVISYFNALTPQYMTVVALEDDCSVMLSASACQYRIDDGEWTSLEADTYTPPINTEQKIQFKGNIEPNYYTGIGTFSFTKTARVEGNPLSLLYGDKVSFNLKNHAFLNLFKDNTNLIEVSYSFLPTATLAVNCYKSMFYGCTNLVNAPALPATTLAEYCYDGMFQGCEALDTVLELPATTLADYCYQHMFEGCINLTTAPVLPSIVMKHSCYRYMFKDCTGLTTTPELPATILANYCYENMFNNCTSLTVVSELPATILRNRCYSSMFKGCTALTTTSALPATELEKYCYDAMFQGCTNLVNTPELPAVKMEYNCYSDMFRDCTSLTSTPVLPATELAAFCYDSMFLGCTALTTTSALPATTLAENCYYCMFYDCTSLTEAPELPATTLASYCYDSMFYSCESLTAAPALPATALASSCYRQMFRYCTKLNYIKMLATDISATDCLSVWAQGVASSGTFVKNSAMTSLPIGTSGIPSGWTVEDAA